MVAEVPRPRLGSQVALGVVVMMHHLGPVAHDDLDAQTRQNRAVPVRRGRRWHDGQGSEGGREQKLLTHGCLSQQVFASVPRACLAPFERPLSVLFMSHSVGPN
jgi:hypothetical protein